VLGSRNECNKRRLLCTYIYILSIMIVSKFDSEKKAKRIDDIDNTAWVSRVEFRGRRARENRYRSYFSFVRLIRIHANRVLNTRARLVSHDRGSYAAINVVRTIVLFPLSSTVDRCVGRIDRYKPRMYIRI